jgi:hypothetical protein
MTIEKIYYGYMVLAGSLIGATLVAVPGFQDFMIPPYFWVLIAVGLFDGGAFLFRRNAPWTMLSMPARLIGFVIGIGLMAAIPMLAGSPARFI